MVRQAVLKNKDPSQLLEEMEKIDEMGNFRGKKKTTSSTFIFLLFLEYNVLEPSPLNEKVLKEKRKKLKETFDRVMRLLHEEEPEVWSEMKRKEVEYEKKKYKRVQYYESVRHAEQVSIEDIPLPSATSDKPLAGTAPKINLPPPILLTNVPPPTTKKLDDIIEQSQENKEKEPPGVPSSMPPDLFEMRELDSDYESENNESDENEEEIIPAKDESQKDKHDQNIEDFMKEVESVQKKEEERVIEIRIDPTPDVDMEEKNEEPLAENRNPVVEPEIETPKIPQEIHIPQIPQTMPPINLPRMPPHPLMFRPPPLRMPGMSGIRMPPGPPNMPRPPNMQRMGLPPRHKHHHHHERNMPPKQSTTTITAKPQIRNLSADVTRFVPATLRTKRDEPKKVKPKSYLPETQMQQVSKQQQQKPTKDDAYQQFMSELQDLL
jgi:WW domain-binding protein 11